MRKPKGRLDKVKEVVDGVLIHGGSGDGSQGREVAGRGRNIGITKWSVTFFPGSRPQYDN